jgi:hypothetical protein
MREAAEPGTQSKMPPLIRPLRISLPSQFTDPRREGGSISAFHFWRFFCADTRIVPRVDQMTLRTVSMDHIFLAVVVAFLLVLAVVNFGSALFAVAAFGIAIAIRLVRGGQYAWRRTL